MEWGVVVAADRGAEWLFPWWWQCYSKHHEEPVAFIDFGMSKQARQWCRTRGMLIPFGGPTHLACPKELLAPCKQKKWEAIYGPKVWHARSSWFKKPLAMLQTPFQKTVWMDLDCEVCKPMGAIFDGITSGMLGAVRVQKQGHYNSGVIVYDKEASLLKAWAQACLIKHGSAIGDETLLSQLIRRNRYPFKEIGAEFNWVMGWGYDTRIIIAHWVASWGKVWIETMGGIQNFIEQHSLNRCDESR